MGFILFLAIIAGVGIYADYNQDQGISQMKLEEREGIGHDR